MLLEYGDHNPQLAAITHFRYGSGAKALTWVGGQAHLLDVDPQQLRATIEAHGAAVMQRGANFFVAGKITNVEAEMNGAETRVWFGSDSERVAEPTADFKAALDAAL